MNYIIFIFLIVIIILIYYLSNQKSIISNLIKGRRITPFPDIPTPSGCAPTYQNLSNHSQVCFGNFIQNVVYCSKTNSYNWICEQDDFFCPANCPRVQSKNNVSIYTNFVNNNNEIVPYYLNIDASNNFYLSNNSSTFYNVTAIDASSTTFSLNLATNSQTGITIQNENGNIILITSIFPSLFNYNCGILSTSDNKYKLSINLEDETLSKYIFVPWDNNFTSQIECTKTFLWFFT